MSKTYKDIKTFGIRRTWGELKPVTKIKQSKKIYRRQENKKIDW